MIVYYSRSGNSKAYAEVLSSQIRSRVHALEDTKPYNNIGIVIGIVKALFNKVSAVKRMPELGKDRTIYVCSPVWAGGIPPAVRYFLQNSNLKGRTVNFILTCQSFGIERMKIKFEKTLKSDSYALGEILIFVCPGKSDRDVSIIREHLREMVNGGRTIKDK